MTARAVTIFCPDEHLVYDARTPDRQGVGGGVTVRIRLARALSRLGHRVTMLVNCPAERTFAGVRYRPWRAARRIDADVLVLTTSGDRVDLRPILDVEVRARLRVVWVHGAPPGGLHEVGLDYVCAPSNFVRRVALRDWSLSPRTLFVAYNAADVPRRPLGPWRRTPRDPFRMVYTSHPSKGLDASIEVLRILRRRDPRFELHVYGGARLWGGPDVAVPAEPGVVDHGLIGQARLAEELTRANVSLSLQAREEPFGVTVLEAMRAGCAVLASPVGAYPELIRHGENGYLIQGDHRDPATWQRAADVVSRFVACRDHAEYIRHNARAIPWDWPTMARTWAGHWDWALEPSSSPNPPFGAPCPECGGSLLPLADGHHCTGCGSYTRGM